MERIEEGLEPTSTPETRARKTRSDAGKPKPKKEPPQDKVGKLSTEQVAHIDKLREAWFIAIEANTGAESSMLNAQKAYYTYLEEITAK